MLIDKNLVLGFLSGCWDHEPNFLSVKRHPGPEGVATRLGFYTYLSGALGAGDNNVLEACVPKTGGGKR